MGTEPPDRARPTPFPPMTLALAGVGVAATALLPDSVRPWNLSAIGAVALFAAARLGFAQALAVTGVALVVKDLGVYLIHGWQPEPFSWLCFAGYAAIGRLTLRGTESPARIGGGAVAASVLFFLTSNFGSWLEQAAPYGYSAAGLWDCYVAAIPFYPGTFAGDLVYTGVLFGLHAALSRALFPAERVAVRREGGR